MNILLIIDPQNDFCNPGDENGNNKGSLYVPNAEEDMGRLAWFILSNIENINHIAVTLDSHYINDISHPNFWTDKDGNRPEAFTQISLEDIIAKKWMPLFSPERVKDYFEKLEKQNEYPHTIWPEHCLLGSEGAAIYRPVLDAISQWSRRGKFYQPIMKGQYPFSEHFGAFAAQVSFDDVPETKINTALIDELGQFETIYLAGQAKSHCVANTVKQLIDYAPGLVQKLTILEDTMSDVEGFENFAEKIYQKAEELGAKIMKTSEID